MRPKEMVHVTFIAALLIVMNLAWPFPVLCQGKVADSTIPKTFAVASIRRNPKPTYMRMEFTVNGLWAEGVTLRQLIQMAYGIFGYDRLVGEPPWVDSDYFDVKARIEELPDGSYADVSLDQREQMLQSLLADRFGLVVRRASVERPVYDLVTAKGGPRLETTLADDISHSAISGVKGLIEHSNRGCVDVVGFSMDALALYLEGQRIVDRPVVNRTGLDGFYSFSLHWYPGNLPAQSNIGSDRPQDALVPPDPPGGSTIFAEIRKQLGLKLRPSKGPVEILIFERASEPTAN